MSIATARSAEPLDRFAQAEATFWGLVRRLQSGDTARMSHSDLERLLEQEGRELMRQLLQAHLDRRAESKAEGPVVGADGIERTHARAGTRELETVFGPVTVSRDGHGARAHETLFPLDAALNLPAERYSFGVRQRAADEASKGAFDEVVRVLATYSGAEIAKRLQRSPELTQGCSPKVDHSDLLPLTRASADAHEAALLYLSPMVCAGPSRRPSPARVFGAGVSAGAPRADASLVASS
jgi:hypothetical protein